MKRKITKDIIAHLPQKQLSLLIGQMGSGKTYVLKELGNLLSKNGFTNFFLDFDNISMSMYLNESPERIFRFIPHPDELEKKPFYLLLDNLQQLKQPYFLLDYLYDKFKSQIKVIAAGSSDFYLNSIGEDALPGKKKIFRIRGFDFDEFLKAKNRIDLLRLIQVYGLDNTAIPSRMEEIQKLMEEYLIFGSLPEIVFAKKEATKIKLLEQYKLNIIRKEGTKSKIEHLDKFAQLATTLALNNGALYNKNLFSKNIGLGSLTLERYTNVLKRNGHLYLVSPFHHSKPKEIIKMPKIYFNDLGIRNAFLQNFNPFALRTDKQQLLSNFLYLQLLELHDIKDIQYWASTDNPSVDFILKDKKKKLKALFVHVKNLDFKVSKYKRFISYYPEIQLQLQTLDKENWILSSFMDSFMESLSEEVFALD